MDNSIQASFEFSLEWRSDVVMHRERCFFPKINFSRDFFPGSIGDKLKNLTPGDIVSESLGAGKIVEPFDKNKIYRIPKHKLNLKKMSEKSIHLRQGRFYPRSALASIGFSSQDIRPFRVLDSNETVVSIDTNHSLSPYPLTIHGKICEILDQRYERGGSSNDIGLAITDGGPGLQANLPQTKTRFFDDDPFVREDMSDDRMFYQTPRLVNHIDHKASEMIAEIYKRFINPGMKVLDLMAGWQSHLTARPEEVTLTGLGLNREELERNRHVNHLVVHDLNQNPNLPFSEAEYDGVICSVSIEYLINPFEVVTEVGRVLKPGAPFIITFSDRWFESKAIRIWSELHPFERMGLISRYLLESGLFCDIHTESARGYSRPEEDRYIAVRKESDPVFAVWGFKNSSL